MIQFLERQIEKPLVIATGVIMFMISAAFKGYEYGEKLAMAVFR